jgi:flagellin
MPGSYPEQDVTMLSIQTNVASLMAQQNFNTNANFQTKTIEAITSGYRINQSGDDAAGLVQANQDRSQVTELTQGVLNANSALSTLQIADGAMNNISNMLDRLKTLATQAASGAGNTTEFNDVLTEIDREAASITPGTLAVYVGGGSDAANSTVNVTLSAVDSKSLLGSTAPKIDSASDAEAAITAINGAVTTLGAAQTSVGAGENDLTYATSLANSQITNTSAAESSIRDADMASEAANLTKAQTLQQASLAAMAQANSAPQAVLSLLKQ